MGRIRYAVRSLTKAPLLSLVMVGSLGLGIGVNTAIFSLLHQVVLSELPIPHPEQLVLLTSPGNLKSGSSSTNDSGEMDYVFNWRAFREFEKHAEAATVVGFRRIRANIAFSRQTVNGSAMLVSGRYFAAIGVQPLIGRLIGPDDDTPGAGNAVAVLDYRYWRERLGAEPGVLNQPVRVNGQTFTVVGIAPAAFTGTTVGSEPDLFVPMSFKPHLTEGWNGTDRLDDYWVYLLARLNHGVTRAQAEAALNGPYSGVIDEMVSGIPVPAEKAARFRQQKLTLQDGRRGNSGFRDEYRSALQILMLATGMVLLIAMANAANLLLVRSADRRREMAVRAAIGAGHGELMAQLLAEALLLACVGGAAGLAIAAITLRLLLVPWGTMLRGSFASTGLDWPVLLFSLGLSIVTGVLFGLYPAWDAARVPVAGILTGESSKASSSRAAARLRKALVCAQMTIAIVLLVPTGLSIKSLIQLLHVDVGMRTANVIGFQISPQWNGNTPAQSKAIFERAETELAAIPGVRSAVGARVPLLGGSNYGTSIWTEGMDPKGRGKNSKYNAVGPDFFSKAGIPLIAGREIRDTDTASAPKVVVVNETFVREFYGADNPIGRRLKTGTDGQYAEIVGVVKDSHYAGVRQQTPPVFYRPWRQDDRIGAISFYVRTGMAPAQVAPQIRAVMRSIAPDVPIEDLRTLEEQVHYSLRTDEMMMRLALSFAGLATVLAMLGLYGVMAHGVKQRTREIGIRMALGARPSRIGTLVMRDLVWILGFSLGVGIPAALSAARLIESQLYGVNGRDATIVAAAAVVLAFTAAAAAFWPAWRASRVNPLDALRYE